ncbi:MAG: translesion error-prone DNA polymerase V autoproteolytic subunit, partial [Bacteroidales bacterium]|nr:translesion error-prone DNA polymerase V autoproteolytic subunit [Bacteroidales bacterium]MDD7759897.1 translesion error-prone DNA polymerase V autoproteolytic subunit [Bacteroidales bacterium]
NRDLIEHPSSTFYGRVVGDSMSEEGITEGDILVIDKSLDPENGDLAVCCLDGEFTLKRIEITPDRRLLLMPSNRNYQPIEVTEDNEFMVWGIVVYTIKANRRRRKI